MYTVDKDGKRNVTLHLYPENRALADLSTMLLFVVLGNGTGSVSLQQYHAETMQSPDCFDLSLEKEQRDFFFFFLAKYARTISNVPT